MQDLSRLVSSKYNKNYHEKCLCQYCLQGCTTEEVLKNHWKNASYTGCKEFSSQKLMTRRVVTKSNLQNQNANYVYLLLSTRILKGFYVSKIRVSHSHGNLSPPNTSITYHVGAAFAWNAVTGNTLNHPK